MNPPLKFLEVGYIRPVDRDESKFKSKTCKDAVRAFFGNTERAKSIATLPGFSFLIGARWTAACTNAAYGTIGRHASEAKKKKYAPLLHHRAMANMAKLMQGSPIDEPWRELLETTTMFEVFNRMSGDYQHKVVENVLRSMLIDSWGCLEVLFQALYRGAESECARFPKRTEKQEKSDWIGFTSLKKTASSYEKSFNDATMAAIFADASLEAMRLLRNVIVHKAGVADTEFKDGLGVAAPWLDTFEGLIPDRDIVVIDGLFVRKIVDSSFECGAKLIKAVDDWI